jgi:hypothetical protein
MKRNINLNRIKKNYAYSINDIGESFGKHKNTVCNWIKEGLKTIDGKKPFLIHGSDLREFLEQKQNARKSKCKDDELFCTKCQKPQKPWGNLVDVFIRAKNKVRLQGLCAVCECKINKDFKVKNWGLVQKTFDVGKVHNPHLIECLINAANCDFN